MLQHRTLRQHREVLAANREAFELDLPRTKKTVVSHLRRCGYTLLSPSNPPLLVDEYVEAIFDTQDREPFFNVPSKLPYCWNSPQHWDKNYIRYEWGHLISRNQNVAADDIMNLCLQSARCNQHAQTSMDIEEVLMWLKGSPVAQRIKTVMQARSELFASAQWRNLLEQFEKYRPKQSPLFQRL